MITNDLIEFKEKIAFAIVDYTNKTGAVPVEIKSGCYGITEGLITIDVSCIQVKLEEL